MRLELLLPIILPLFAGALSLALWRSLWLQRALAVVMTLAMTLAGAWLLHSVSGEGYLVTDMGGWEAPFGITLVADIMAAIMVLMTGVMGLIVTVYSLGSIPEGHERFGYYPLMHLLLAGVAGAFLTGDIFNLFVWFEVLLLASFALMTLGGERAQMEGAIKYVTLNLFASAIFLSAVGITYGMLGTLNMADIAQKVGQLEPEDTGMITVVAMMYMVAFGIKAAAFPLFFWLPASYHTPPVAVSALFAALLTKVGVYALFRFFTLIFDQDVSYTHGIMLWAGALGMLAGVLGAAAQFEFRRILAFHSVSQIGYMIVALALMSPLAILGGIFYIVHHMIVKSALFLVSGVTYRLMGSHELKDLGGFYKHRPGLAVLFLIQALALAGIPPLFGFFAKFAVIRAGIEAGEFVVAGVGLLVGLLTLYSMIKIWAEVFWKKVPDHVTDTDRLTGVVADSSIWLLYLPLILMAIATVALGLFGQPFYTLVEAGAHQLLNPEGYIEAVLGRGE
ncbi:MAG: Na+/H+ antiporter subunit D [Halomonadaceae bacterium]|nr:MAG: Na+/H+ antiporter subunit D [Halomonadaceae bacterium]